MAKDTGMTQASVCVIFNQASGKKGETAEAKRAEQLLRENPRLDLRIPRRPSAVTAEVEKAVGEGFGTIVAAGGDGTMGAVVSALVSTDVKLGIVPMGTFNFLARGLGIPEDPAEAIDVALNGEDAPLAVGEVNGHVFLNNASLGAYAAVLGVREGIYRRWGRSRIAAYWSVIVAMLTIYRPLSMRITVDGEACQVRSPMAFVASSAYQLEQYGFDGVDAVREGKLALFLAPDSGRIMLLWRAVKILFGGVRRDVDYRLLVGRDILIETKRGRRLVARDGEKQSMDGPFHFCIRSNAVTVKVPRRTAGTTG